MGKKLLLTLMFLGVAQMALAGVITFDTAPLGFLDMQYSENADDPDLLWGLFLVQEEAGGNRYVQNTLSLSTIIAGSTFDFFAADFRGVAPETSIVYTGTQDVAGDVVPFSGVIDGLTGTWDNRILGLTNLFDLAFTPGGGGTFNMDNAAVYDGGSAPAIPVPGAIVLGGIGTLCVGWLRRRRAILLIEVE